MWAEGETHTTLVVYIGIMRIEFNHSLFLTHIWKWIETCVNTGSRLIESHYGCMEINHSWNLESNLSCKGFLCTGNWFDKLKGWRKHNLFCLMVPKLSLEQYYKLIHRLFRQSSLNEIWKQTIFSAKSSVISLMYPRFFCSFDCGLCQNCKHVKRSRRKTKTIVDAIWRLNWMARIRFAAACKDLWQSNMQNEPQRTKPNIQRLYN